jgi:hypothetical protein
VSLARSKGMADEIEAKKAAAGGLDRARAQVAYSRLSAAATWRVFRRKCVRTTRLNHREKAKTL